MNFHSGVQHPGSTQKSSVDDCVAELAIMRKNENFQISTLGVLFYFECTRAPARSTTPHR